MVNYIEKHKNSGRKVLVVFLDIQAAFDTICPKHIKASLLKHGADPDLAEFYYNYITNRHLTTTIGGYTHTITVGIGFSTKRGLLSQILDHCIQRSN